MRRGKLFQSSAVTAEVLSWKQNPLHQRLLVLGKDRSLTVAVRKGRWPGDSFISVMESPLGHFTLFDYLSKSREGKDQWLLKGELDWGIGHKIRPISAGRDEIKGMSEREKAMLMAYAWCFFDKFNHQRVEATWGEGSSIIGDLICRDYHFTSHNQGEIGLMKEWFDTLDGSRVEATLSFDKVEVKSEPKVEILLRHSGDLEGYPVDIFPIIDEE